MSIKKYIQNKRVNHFSVENIEVFVKDEITNNLNAKAIISNIAQLIPRHLLSNIDSIYVGSFDFLTDRQVNAAYENSSIFVTNEQDTEEDMTDDIIHEIAHSVEEMYEREIYSDNKVESEFLQKRKSAWFALKDQGLEAELQYFLNPDYSPEFDSYLYQEVGYPNLAILTSNMFYSPYAITSLREYFANGFEAFFMKEDIDRLKNISPVLFGKIVSLLSSEDNLNWK